MFELIKNRRSIRQFKKMEVEKEKLEIILKSALMSPSSRNQCPWKFIVVRDKELLSRLSDCKESGSTFLKNAPIGIVVFADSTTDDVWVEDASIAAMMIQLSAQSLGLGSCWIQVRERFTKSHQRSNDFVKNVLNISEGISVLCILAIGYPNEVKPSYDEEKLNYSKIHYI